MSGKLSDVPLTERLSEVDKAYLAGLFDGEGTIGYYNYRNRYEPTVMVTNCDPRIMDWLDLNVGYGNVVSLKTTDHNRKHVVHHWRVTGKKRTHDFLKAVAPYLMIKREQADLLLGLWETEATYNKITPAVLEHRAEVADELKRLKRSNLTLTESILH